MPDASARHSPGPRALSCGRASAASAPPTPSTRPPASSTRYPRLRSSPRARIGPAVGRPANGERRPQGPESARILRISGGYHHIVAVSCGFSGTPPAKGADFQGFCAALDPHKETPVNKAELTSALAMRTKMSKADAGRTIEALFDDKGIIAG